MSLSSLANGASIEDVKALVSQSPVPVLIDCYTPSCAPCAALAPVLEEIAAQMQDRIAIEKIDVAANPGVARELRVRGVPALLLYKEGALKAMRTGATTRAQLVEWLSAQGVQV